MATYSMDIRTRVLQDSDAGMTAHAVAEKYRVSASWVRRLKQRRRESGEIAAAAPDPVADADLDAGLASLGDPDHRAA